jgi:hypothetical protein
MDQVEAVRVTVEIVLEQDGIAGTVREPGGGRAPFNGWIGLISVLERCRSGGGLEATEGESR